MSKKIPLGLTIALIFISVAVTLAVTVTVYMDSYNELIQDLPQRAQQYSKLSDIDELVRAQYYGNIDYDKIDASIAGGYINGLEDDYCSYISAENYDTYINYISGLVPGVGINSYYDLSTGYLAISSIDGYSPAAQAGIRKDDYVKSVDKMPVSEKNYKELTEILSDEISSEIEIITLRIDENGNEEELEYKLKCGYKAQSCTFSVNSTIGYIRISNFFDDTYDLFCNALDELNKSGITGLVLDVRSNYSTNIDVAVKIIDKIVPLAFEATGAIATAKNAKEEIIQIFSSDAEAISIPIAVLINDRTEGAAELLACDLRDFGKAYLIGETTMGHGTLQKMFRLDDGGAVVLTVARIYPYSSDCYDGIGVAPDEEIKMTDVQKNSLEALEQSQDGQYQRAYSYLTKTQ